MGKKSLENVTADLAALAAAMPTQRPVAVLLLAPPLSQPELQIAQQRARRSLPLNLSPSSHSAYVSRCERNWRVLPATRI